DHFDYLLGAAEHHADFSHWVLGALATTSLLFLGFDMDGWDFRVLFRSVAPYLRRQNSRTKKAFHAGVQVDFSEGRFLEVDRARRYLQSYFDESDVHIFWGNVEDFSRELRRQRTPTR